MKKIRKQHLCTVLAAAMALALVGCGSGRTGGAQQAETASDFTPAMDTDTSCTIRIVGHYSNFESLEAEFDRFNVYYPNVLLSYTALDSYNNTIGVALSGGDAPNIYCTFPWMLDKASYHELFEAAEDLSDPALNIDLSSVRDRLLYRDAEGRVPMVPVLSTTHGMLVNEDLFSKEGLSIPASYSELLSVCGRLKDLGYSSPVMGNNGDSGLFCSMALPYFYGSVLGDETLAAALNALESSAAESLRPVLELVSDFTEHGCVDLVRCDEEVTDNYQELILRFFEGDVPMMFTGGDCASGTVKRESLSETFTQHPFTYSFHPIPTTEGGGYFLSTGSVEFSVNKNCENLDMTNEFMRFLIRTVELNEMARVKRLVTTSTDLSPDGVYASFSDVPADHTIYEQDIGLLDAPLVQVRRAAWQVGNGHMTIEEAIKAFGTLE